MMGIEFWCHPQLCPYDSARCFRWCLSSQLRIHHLRIFFAFCFWGPLEKKSKMTGSWPPKCDVFCKRRTLLWTTNSFLLTKCWFHLLNIVGGHRLMNCAVSDGQTLLEGTVIRTNSSDFWLQVGNCAQLHLFTMTVSPFLATYWPTCSRVQVDFSGPFLYPIARCNDTKILN